MFQTRFSANIEANMCQTDKQIKIL